MLSTSQTACSQSAALPSAALSSVVPLPEPEITWQIRVNQLVLEARLHPVGSRQRSQCLTQIIRIVAPKLWRFSTPHYADALQQTWLYFSKNICTTYDPDRASVVTWLNSHLRYRHQDLVNQALKRQAHEISIDAESKHQNDSHPKALELPSREYGSLSLLEEIVKWVQTDADGELRRTHLKHHAQITCQTLILLRLAPETPWKAISDQFGVPVPTLSSFYRRHCLPYLKKRALKMGL